MVMSIYSFLILGYIENMHVKGDKVILVHCPEYKSLVNSRKYIYNGLLVRIIQTFVHVIICTKFSSASHFDHFALWYRKYSGH